MSAFLWTFDRLFVRLNQHSNQLNMPNLQQAKPTKPTHKLKSKLHPTDLPPTCQHPSSEVGNSTAYELEFLAIWRDQCDHELLTSSAARKEPWKGTGRRFTADFVYPQGLVYIELDGSVFTVGGHSSGMGITKDRLKDVIAMQRGWIPIRIPTTNIDEMIPFAIGICERRRAMMDCLTAQGFHF